VAVTAFDVESIKEQATKVGIERILAKPVEIELLTAVIKDFYMK